MPVIYYYLYVCVCVCARAPFVVWLHLSNIEYPCNTLRRYIKISKLISKRKNSLILVHELHSGRRQRHSHQTVEKWMNSRIFMKNKNTLFLPPPRRLQTAPAEMHLCWTQTASRGSRGGFQLLLVAEGAEGLPTAGQKDEDYATLIDQIS